MKSLFRSFIISTIGLYLLTIIIPGITAHGGLKTYLTASVALTILNMTVKPILNLLLLPINLLTLGMFRWVVNVITLWLVTYLVKEISIQPFHFSGFTYEGFTLPAMNITIFWATVLGAFTLNIVTTALDWIAKE